MSRDDVDIERLTAAYERGLAAEDAGEIEAAVAAYREVLALDPLDRGGVSLRLAALGAAPPPQTAPRAYVEMMFDEHAEAFDGLLVDDLGYDVPRKLVARLGARGVLPVARALDLGCGTGLVGATLSGRAQELVGVDLSEAMLGQAHRRGIYDMLVRGDVVAAMGGLAKARGAGWFELVLGADLLIYIGDLGPFFDAAMLSLGPGGHLAVSTEASTDSTAPFRVTRGIRYAHAASYLRRSAEAAGFDVLEISELTVRLQSDAPVPGHALIARKPGEGGEAE